MQTLDRGRANLSLGTRPSGNPFPDFTAAPTGVTATGPGVAFGLTTPEEVQPHVLAWDIHNPSGGAITVTLETTLDLENVDGSGDPTHWQTAVETYTGSDTYREFTTANIVARAVRLNLTVNGGAVPVVGRISW